MTMYGSEVFPTGQRARYSSTAWAFNRIGAAAAPFVLLPLLHGAGVVAMVSVIIGTLALSLLVLRFCPQGYAGRAVS
jgi:putative MFS transporter